MKDPQKNVIQLHDYPPLISHPQWCAPLRRFLDVSGAISPHSGETFWIDMEREIPGHAGVSVGLCARRSSQVHRQVALTVHQQPRRYNDDQHPGPYRHAGLPWISAARMRGVKSMGLARAPVTAPAGIGVQCMPPNWRPRERPYTPRLQTLFSQRGHSRMDLKTN